MSNAAQILSNLTSGAAAAAAGAAALAGTNPWLVLAILLVTLLSQVLRHGPVLLPALGDFLIKKAIAGRLGTNRQISQDELIAALGSHGVAPAVPDDPPSTGGLPPAQPPPQPPSPPA